MPSSEVSLLQQDGKDSTLFALQPENNKELQQINLCNLFLPTGCVNRQ